MAVCLKCGGTLNGDRCDRHGHMKRPAPRLVEPVKVQAQPAKHDPMGADTFRRVMAMIKRCCPGCGFSCGDYERCPIQRAKWRGDWAGEFPGGTVEAAPAPSPAAIIEDPPAPPPALTRATRTRAKNTPAQLSLAF